MILTLTEIIQKSVWCVKGSLGPSIHVCNRWNCGNLGKNYVTVWTAWIAISSVKHFEQKLSWELAQAPRHEMIQLGWWEFYFTHTQHPLFIVPAVNIIRLQDNNYLANEGNHNWRRPCMLPPCFDTNPRPLLIFQGVSQRLQHVAGNHEFQMEEGRKIENKNFREPLINASGETPGNNLGSNWPKQSRKWEKSIRATKSCFVSNLCAAPQEFPGPAYTLLASDVPWVQKVGQGGRSLEELSWTRIKGAFSEEKLGSRVGHYATEGCTQTKTCSDSWPFGPTTSSLLMS